MGTAVREEKREEWKKGGGQGGEGRGGMGALISAQKWRRMKIKGEGRVYERREVEWERGKEESGGNEKGEGELEGEEEMEGAG